MLLLILFLVLILIWCFLVIFSTKKEVFTDFSDKEPIDVVYTWVAFDDKLQRDIKKYKNNTGENNEDESNTPIRYISNDELKYSLRSIEKYANWVNKIYIVVHDGQKPTWLKETNRIKIIQHSDIIPMKYLPTFNSLCIESFLYRIPNLSERYIYINDDILLWNYVKPTTFFYKNMTLESSCLSLKDYKNKDKKEASTENYSFDKLIIFNGDLISKYFNITEKNIRSVRHIPFGNIKSLNISLDKFLDTIPYKNTNINEYTKLSKFRQKDNIAQVSIFRKYWYKVNNGIKPSSSNFLYIPFSRLTKKKIKKILKSDYHFICIQNDDNSNTNLLQQMLETKFPNPSSFEK